MRRFERVIIVCLFIAVGLLLRSNLNLRESQKSNQITGIQQHDADLEKYTWEATEFVTGLEVVWDIAFDSKNNLYVTERLGRLQIISPTGQKTANFTLPNVASTGESGLTGITLDPNFDQNQLVYLYYSYREGGELHNRVSSFKLRDGILDSEQFILDKLPGGVIHNGGRLRFGPDKKLWVLTGDAARPASAQDPNSLAGKVLRLNADGSVPGDNPISGSLVYSLGHRNPQGIAWHPLTEEPVITEHGETAHDEINLIGPKQNYGWPAEKKCYARQKNFTDPILCSDNDTYGPSGITALSTTIWKFRNSFLFSGLRGNLVERIEIIDGKIAGRETLIKSKYGRMRAASQAPDGTVYVSTSNRDGRGEVQANDDKIIKLTPQLEK